MQEAHWLQRGYVMLREVEDFEVTFPLYAQRPTSWGNYAVE